LRKVNIEVNSSGEFIYTQFVSENVEQCKHQEIYMKNPQMEKITVKLERERERDSTKSETLQGGLSTLLHIQFLRVRSFAKEEEIDFYS